MQLWAGADARSKSAVDESFTPVWHSGTHTGVGKPKEKREIVIAYTPWYNPENDCGLKAKRFMAARLGMSLLEC